uniref:Uncharacterized protein n=2 Tax=Ixodes scapularis TaxID=6945 RepID=A0A1S4LSM4_IXOSC
ANAPGGLGRNINRDALAWREIPRFPHCKHTGRRGPHAPRGALDGKHPSPMHSLCEDSPWGKPAKSERQRATAVHMGPTAEEAFRRKAETPASRGSVTSALAAGPRHPCVPPQALRASSRSHRTRGRASCASLRRDNRTERSFSQTRESRGISPASATRGGKR